MDTKSLLEKEEERNKKDKNENRNGFDADLFVLLFFFS